MARVNPSFNVMSRSLLRISLRRGNVVMGVMTCLADVRGVAVAPALAGDHALDDAVAASGSAGSRPVGSFPSVFSMKVRRFNTPKKRKEWSCGDGAQRHS
jgi:hypothetical protein